MSTRFTLFAAVSLLSTVLQLEVLGQTSDQETAAVQAKIAAERVAIGKAIAAHDVVVLNRYWSPGLIVNGPENTVVTRSQIIGAMGHGGLNYTTLKGFPEFFTLSNGTAILMSHEDLVPADGPMAGRHLVRRTTDIYQRAGDDWPLVARQATFVGFDATAPGGSVPSTHTEQFAAPETEAIHAQIEANNRDVGQAIKAMDFATLGKLWAPGMVVNSPGNNILTREQVFNAMREDKLKYATSTTTPEAFFVIRDLAIEMGHDDVVLAGGPMAGKPLTRRFTNVWRKTGDSWVQIARQATYVGIDGGAVYGHPDPTLKL